MDTVVNANVRRKTIDIKGKNPVCVSFVSQIDLATTSPLIATLSELVNKNHDEIHLFLSTSCGSVADGIAIYNFIRALPVPLITYNIGQVNSIGNVVYQAGENRIASKTCSFMFHGVGFDIKNARMELKDLRERTQSIENDQGLITNIMVERTSLPVDKVNSMFLEMENIGADEALECGLTDEVTDFRLPNGMPIVSLVFQR